MILLLCVSAASVVGFFWWEGKAPHPLLDLRFLRVPRFLVANVVAFSAYFATFAVFFFTALYLEEVVGYSGYDIALVFLPMMVLMAAAAMLSARWTVEFGPKWSIFTGCIVFALGLLLTSFAISPNPGYVPLAAALAVTGIGVGSTVVPATSSALSAVPPERSGMAASATNTSREIGAVTGVAVLGALVSAKLTADITARLQALGLPRSISQIVINGVETGLVPSSGKTKGAGGAAGAGQGKLVQEVIQAAYSAFQSGLHAALYLSAILVLAAGLFSFYWLGRDRPARQASPAPVELGAPSNNGCMSRVRHRRRRDLTACPATQRGCTPLSAPGIMSPHRSARGSCSRWRGRPAPGPIAPR